MFAFQLVASEPVPDEPAYLGALVPRSIHSTTAVLTPLAALNASETRMFSIDCGVRAQPRQLSKNAFETKVPVVSNMFAGKLERLEQFIQVLLKLVPEDVSISGKEVRDEQPNQVTRKFVPKEVSISGKLVDSPRVAMLSRLLQLFHICLNIFADPSKVFIRNKDFPH